jgi:hypothetical protein
MPLPLDWRRSALPPRAQDKPGLPELDISNPIVSPDGKWLAFQRSDSASGKIGEGQGIYMYRLP